MIKYKYKEYWELPNKDKINYAFDINCCGVRYIINFPKTKDIINPTEIVKALKRLISRLSIRHSNENRKAGKLIIIELSKVQNSFLNEVLKEINFNLDFVHKNNYYYSKVC